MDSLQAIREQLDEQKEALQEVEAALQHGDDAEMIQVRACDHFVIHFREATVLALLMDGLPMASLAMFISYFKGPWGLP